MNENLVYIGKIIAMEEIPGADFIASATVICGKGGKWRGVVRKTDLKLGDFCIVFLPDSLITEETAKFYEMEFMKATDYRIKMRRFKGAPSEVVIIPIESPSILENVQVGCDLTGLFGVTKYQKPIAPHLQGKIKGDFPSFIPKTDEPNYQNSEGQEGIQKLIGQPYYITQKADGSSTTAYKYKGQFGVCSRNYELERDEENGYWKVALKYDLENKLPEGMAIQWETCGPKIQGNPMGWDEVQGLMFSAYNIIEQRYLEFFELCKLSINLNFPLVMFYEQNDYFTSDGIELLGEGNYHNGKPQEGVVVRSCKNLLGHKPVSFKVINLSYER